MIITENVVGLMLINIVIYCLLILAVKKISDSDYSELIFIFIFIGISYIFVNDYIIDGTYDIIVHIFSWLNQFSALQLFFIFIIPLIISVPIFYLFSKPDYSRNIRLKIYLNEIKAKISNYKDGKKRNKSKKLDDKKEKLKLKETKKTKAMESKLEDLLFDYAAKNNGIIMKSEIFDITKKYQKRDVLNVIEKLKEESLIESQDNSYMFPNLI